MLDLVQTIQKEREPKKITQLNKPKHHKGQQILLMTTQQQKLIEG